MRKYLIRLNNFDDASSFNNTCGMTIKNPIYNRYENNSNVPQISHNFKFQKSKIMKNHALFTTKGFNNTANILGTNKQPKFNREAIVLKTQNINSQEAESMPSSMKRDKNFDKGELTVKIKNAGKVYYEGFHNNGSTNINRFNIPRIPSFEKLGVHPDKNLISLKKTRKLSQALSMIERKGHQEDQELLSRNQISKIVKPFASKI